jgi:hypothetical protein
MIPLAKLTHQAPEVDDGCRRKIKTSDPGRTNHHQEEGALQ